MSGRINLGQGPPMPWVKDANCRGVSPELFHPGQGESTDEAKAVCRGCVVRLQCLEHAIVHVEKYGIWGGLSERERRPLRKQRKGAA